MGASASSWYDPRNLMGARDNRDAAAANAQRAADAEAAREKGIAETTGKINSIYDSPERQAQYGDFINAVREKYNTDLGRQSVIANRENKFAIARSGLSGGSRDVDSKRQLGEERAQGILGAENKAQAALGDLKAADNTSRLNLIGLARSGLDATTAASRAMSGLQVGAESARADALQQGIGDVFAATNANVKKQQEAAALREGRRAPVGSFYGKQ